MVVVSLAINIVVLFAVTGSLVRGAGWTREAFGDRSPARDILLAVYIAILTGSVALLVATTVVSAAWVVGAVVAMLSLQVVYKVLTAITVRNALRNPVVVSNLLIAAVHAVTIVTVLPEVS